MDDLAIKSISLQCRDADAAISYTGLACMNDRPVNSPLGFDEEDRTDRWLVRVLQNIGAHRMNIDVLSEALRDRLTPTIRGLRYPRCNKSLSVVIAGYCYATRRPFVVLISNFEDRNRILGVRDDFTVYVSQPHSEHPRAYLLSINGQSLGNPLLRRLTRLLWKRLPNMDGRKVTRHLVWFIRAATRLSVPYIGRSCTSLLISSGSPPFGEFHHDGQTSVSLAPHAILRVGAYVMDISFDTR